MLQRPYSEVCIYLRNRVRASLLSFFSGFHMYKERHMRMSENEIIRYRKSVFAHQKWHSSQMHVGVYFFICCAIWSKGKMLGQNRVFEIFCWSSKLEFLNDDQEGFRICPMFMNSSATLLIVSRSWRVAIKPF